MFAARYWTFTCGREGEEFRGTPNVRVVKSKADETLGVEDGVVGAHAVRVLDGFSDPAGIRLAKRGI